MVAERQTLDIAKPKAEQHLSKTLGVAVGGLTVVGFMAIHGVWIADIWYSLDRMVFAGALSGFCVVWSYNQAVTERSPKRWLTYNAVNAGLLIALGAASFLVFEPKFTMAEAMVMEDTLAELVPPAIPLMIAAMIIGTGVIWALFGRKTRGLVAVFVTQILLVFLIGHNLAILGLVESTGTLFEVTTELTGLTIFLAGVFAVGVMAGDRLVMRVRTGV